MSGQIEAKSFHDLQMFVHVLSVCNKNVKFIRVSPKPKTENRAIFIAFLPKKFTVQYYLFMFCQKGIRVRQKLTKQSEED